MVDLSKVTLTKNAPTVSLAKKAVGGELRINLSWEQPPPRGLFRKRDGIDLDLGALYELTTGKKGCIQALGNAFGSLAGPPYMQLDGDDRSGGTAGENLRINLDHAAQIKRVLVFAYIYQGAPAFDAAHGVVTLYPREGQPIEVRLDEHAGDRPMCAVALLENTGGDLVIRREVRYIAGFHQQLDDAYSFGMNWKAGRK
jgi:tellurite resistance protein TerA